MTKKKDLMNVEKLEEAFGGDKDLVMFFISWLKHDKNATKAYHHLHPKITPASAKAMGSTYYNRLIKHNLAVVLDSYGLGPDKYLKVLKEGLEATKYEDTGDEKIEVTDHNARRKYHEALGKMIGFEKNDKPDNNTAIQINVEYKTPE